MKEKFIVDFQVIGTCNMTCNFCDGAPKSMKGENSEDVITTIQKLVDVGLDTLVISGGEPLLRKDIVDIIRFSHSKGLEVYLSTNGLLLPPVYSLIKDYIVCIGLPLDGSSREMHKLMTRNPRQYDATVGMLEYFIPHAPQHIVKVGTVVSQVNKQDLGNIANILFNRPHLYHPDAWRLYQFSPLGDGLFTRHTHWVDDAEFREITEELIRRYPKKNITTLTNSGSDDAYIFINPNLEIELLTGGVYKVIGDMKAISRKRLLEIKKDIMATRKRSDANREWMRRKNG